MSDNLRKAIEELAKKWEAERDFYASGMLRALLDANPEPEPEWEFGYQTEHEAYPLLVGGEDKARASLEWRAWAHKHTGTIYKRIKATAPGPWVEVTEP